VCVLCITTDQGRKLDQACFCGILSHSEGVCLLEPRTEEVVCEYGCHVSRA
jgi:hypothetical protein